jgi:hypothetical protein
MEKQPLVPSPSTLTPTGRPTPTPERSHPDGSPSVILIVDGQEQVGGAGDFCGWSSKGPGICFDTFGDVQIPSEAVVLKPGQEVIFRVPPNPGQLTLFVYEAKGNSKSSRLFNPLSHKELYAEDIDLSQESLFRPRLEPGKYILVLYGVWSQGGSGFEASYGFNIVVKD